MKTVPSIFDSPEMLQVLNGVPHGVVLLDKNLCIVAMNRFLEVMTGYLINEIKGVYGDYVLRSNLDSKDRVCKKVMENGQSVSRNGNILNRKRHTIPIHFTLTRINDLLGNPSGVMIVLEDITTLSAERVTLLVDGQRFGILGQSPQMEKVFELLSVLARTDASVLITGETGTGKDLLAEALHKSSSRNRQPFIKVNCGALPEALLESELFGHAKGAFTGAIQENPGMFRLAHGGTIFLTEIGDLSQQLQVKLLSVLDDQEFYPVGDSKKVKVDVRIIAATHRSLRYEVEQERFREDLFYRLNVLHLHMPPLRERTGDILLLLDHFLGIINEKLKREITGFTKESVDMLEKYHYPGNVRELRNIVEYAVNICQGRKVTINDLPDYIFKQQEPSFPITKNPIKYETTSSVKKQSITNTIGGWTELEKEMIMDALRKASGNRSKAAEILGWGRTTLWRKLKKYGLN